MATKQDNIIFMSGKEKGLLKLFSQDQGCFGYVALGYNQDNDTNGFINPTGEGTLQNGFYEITGDSSYQRAKLIPHENAFYDPDNGEVTVKFLAEFDVDNIVSGATINQLAIVDSQDPNNDSTNFYAAAVCDDDYHKSEQLSIVFIIEMTI